MWIEKLGGYYKHTKPSEELIKALIERFSGYDEHTLDRAVTLYYEDGDYFPTIKQFRPYVEMSLYDEPKLTPLQQVERMTWEQKQIADDERFAIETAIQGGDGLDFSSYGMRSMAEIDAEVQEARVKLAEIRAGMT